MAELTVKGVGKISLPADQIIIDMTIESKHEDYNTVTDLQHQKTEEVKNAVEDLGFDRSRLKTSSFNVTTDYENVQNDNGRWERKFAGYRAVHCLSLKFDFDTEKLKWIISAITSCKKASPTFNISFTVKDREETCEKLLELAVKDAVKKAAVLSSAANVELGNIMSITYNDQAADFYSATNIASQLYRGVDNAREAACDIPITPENIRSQLEVTVVWEITA